MSKSTATLLLGLGAMLFVAMFAACSDEPSTPPSDRVVPGTAVAAQPVATPEPTATLAVRTSTGANCCSHTGANRHSCSCPDRHSHAGADGHADSGPNEHTYADIYGHTYSGANSHSYSCPDRYSHSRADGSANHRTNAGANRYSHPGA